MNYLKTRLPPPSGILGEEKSQWGLRLGMWYWKDDTKTLEFRSFVPAIENRDKGKKGKGVHFAEMDGPATERLTDKRHASREDKSTKALEKRSQQGTVTLDDVKFVALLSLEATEMQRICSFTTFLREKISDTQKDWKFFESFYTFCTHVAWIVFRRQNLIEIEDEVGRLFRSNMFNISRRKREDAQLGGEKKRMTLVQFRRMMAKRPAIKKAMDMRSPVMSTLLPSLREKAQHIIERKYQAGTKPPAHAPKHMLSPDSVPMPVVGILGEPRYMFNLHTLTPLDPEENVKPSGRNASLIERNNLRVQEFLDTALWTLSFQNPK
ncbi:protein phosphatase 1 regulatory subunit 36 isoform X4 [Perognathus longimembris pacificus]|uniref:protein phosphatase 1 regulatory subunit 36 isoform X4 n=1 Tax=Perognathus longimembris pacificus TaxID=214514 RepID=UPI002019BC36|nr:protein phosphatase 1 regulatory subunit 36 isoform X4 [Perognathus longimembris pacificus]